MGSAGCAGFAAFRDDLAEDAREGEGFGLATPALDELVRLLDPSAEPDLGVFGEAAFTLVGLDEAPAGLVLASAFFPRAAFLDGVCLATPGSQSTLREVRKSLSRKKKQTI